MKQHYISDILIPIISVKLGCRYVPNIPLSLCSYCSSGLLCLGLTIALSLNSFCPYVLFYSSVPPS